MFSSMTKTILQSLFKKPVTRLYPLQIREPFQATRGKIEYDEPSCVYCGGCERRCPTKAIKVLRAEKHFELNRHKCITCGACIDACPKKCLAFSGKYTTPSSEHVIDKWDAVASTEKVDERN